MSNPIHLVVILAGFLVWPARLVSQEPIPAGHRVRITHDCRTRTPVTGRVATVCRQQAGTLLEVGADSLALGINGRTVRYRLANVTRVELSRGRRSRWLTGGVVGSAVGGVTAFAVLNSGGSTSLCDQSQNQDAVGFSECLGLSVLFGVLPGFGLGALVGAVARGERWEELPPGRIRIGWVPSGRGALRFTMQVAR